MTLQDLESLLRKHNFLQGMSPEHTKVLVGCTSNVRFAAGDFLMHEGREANVFYLLRAGRISLETNVPGRGPLEMESLGPGDVLGLSWLVPPYREHLDARALEPVVALAMDGKCLRAKCDADHDLGYALLRRIFELAYQRLMRVRLQRLDLYGT